MLELSSLENVAVCFDNWFSHSSTVSLLSMMNVPCTATVRSDRVGKAPIQKIESMKKKDIPRGSVSASSSKDWNVNVIRWKDNSVVTLTSNHEGVEPT